MNAAGITDKSILRTKLRDEIDEVKMKEYLNELFKFFNKDKSLEMNIEALFQKIDNLYDKLRLDTDK